MSCQVARRATEERAPRLPSGAAECSTGQVTSAGLVQCHTFRVCLLAMDQLSVDDRLCRSASRRA
jgi:hypothetical protein